MDPERRRRRSKSPPLPNHHHRTTTNYNHHHHQPVLVRKHQTGGGANHLHHHHQNHDQQVGPFNNYRSSAATNSTATTTTTVASSLNNHKDAEDLHAWSLFRQNLNANFSESVLGANLSSTSTSTVGAGSGGQPSNGGLNQPPTTTNNNNKSSTKMATNGQQQGSFPLRESTVNNILSHPKYGAQLKNQDAFTYLRFGLPRVKTAAGSGGGNSRSGQSSSSNHSEDDRKIPKGTTAAVTALDDGGKSKQRSKDGGGAGVSAAINEELKRRFWTTSDQNLLRSESNESDSSGKDLSSSAAGAINHRQHHRTGSPTTNGHHHHRHHHHPHHQQSSGTQQKTHFNNRYNPQPPPSSSERFVSAKPGTNARSHPTKLSRGELHNHHHHHHHHHDSMMMMENDDPAQQRISPFTTDEDLPLDDVAYIGRTGSPGGVGPSSSLPPPLAKHPHLVVKDLMYEVDKSSNWRRLCGFSRQKLRVLEDISFDVRGGELMAVMATSAHEGTALLNVLASRHDRRNGTARAEIYLNGVLISPRHLSRLMAYVSKNMQICSEMSTRQALLFAGLLMGPASRSSTDVKRLTRTLLEELNLGEVRHTKISELTFSERRRLHIAMHLLLDTELLMIDQPLIGLDIFDAFFLVEYLRQWAMVGCRSVIMTLSPPTYEIFTMIHRVVLISAGRPLYVGQRKDFLKYFTSIGYPCPPFKNPSDYYLDLVTVDDLSQEALLESSQRIETLADIHSRRSMAEIFSSMPGPPAVLPAPFRRANFAMQFLALWIRALIFSFPYNVVHLFGRFMLTLTLSLVIGGIYWQVRTGREQEHVWDRIGFITTMLSVAIVPVLGAELIYAHSEKKFITSEVHQGFYSLPAYMLSKLLYSTPQSILIGMAYALPACSMAGLQLHANPNSLPFYLLLMLSYYLALRSMVFASVWICRRRSTAAFLFGTVFTIFLLSSGIIVQYRDISITHRWLRQVSPVRWLHEAMLAWEFEPNSITTDTGTSMPFLCGRNPVIQQPNAILVRADCGFQTRANILKWFEYQGGNIASSSSSSSSSSSGTKSINLRPAWHAFMALLALYLCSFLAGVIIFSIKIYCYYHEDGIQDKISSVTR